jgi:hypothetical protein
MDKQRVDAEGLRLGGPREELDGGRDLAQAREQRLARG